jgi:hypothetical protein
MEGRVRDQPFRFSLAGRAFWNSIIRYTLEFLEFPAAFGTPVFINGHCKNLLYRNFSITYISDMILIAETIEHKIESLMRNRLQY